MAVFIFGMIDFTILVIHVYFCIALWLYYAVTNPGIILSADSNIKFRLLCTHSVPILYVRSEVKLREILAKYAEV